MSQVFEETREQEPVSELRTGRISNAEIDVIKANYRYMSPDEIARKLNRRTDTVERYIENNLGKTLQQEHIKKATLEIQHREYWQEIKKQFTEEEQNLILYHWSRLIAQFKEDILHSEEITAVDMVKLEVMMNRILLEIQDSSTSVRNLQKVVEDEMRKPREDRDIDLIRDCERELNQARTTQQTLDKQYLAFSEQKEKLMKSLKGTRDARLKDIEQSKTSFIDWVKTLIKNEDLRRDMGKKMERFRLAMEQEYKRLSESIQYDDGQYDKPLLNSETVEND